jgi:hypothetical protein
MEDIPIVKWDKKTEGEDAEYYNKVGTGSCAL